MRTTWLRATAVLLMASTVAACASPESECRDGLAKMKARTQSFVGLDQPDDVRMALERVNMAETQLATGSHEGCIESLKEAAALLNKSQRTNQQ